MARILTNSQVSNMQEGLEYVTSCTLATVEKIATTKRRPVGEYSRQISIAQAGVDFLRSYGKFPTGAARFSELVRHGYSVKRWAASMHPLPKENPHA